MFKKILLQVVAICFVFGFTCIIQAEEKKGTIKIGEGTTVGGHVKIKLGDYTKGKRDNNGVEEEDSQYMGFGFAELHLIFSADISEKVSVYFQPEWRASTGATPTFGYNIGKQTNKERGADEELAYAGLVKGIIKWIGPFGFEISAGIVKPRFTLEYGAELFWEDEYHGGKFAANNYLGAMHETGIEIYRNFEVGSISVPVYFYVLNGNAEEYSDNNEGTMNMIHIEPEFGNVKLVGSYAYGRYDDNEHLVAQRWAGGISIDIKGFFIRGEYAGGIWEKAIDEDGDGVNEDYTPMGFYLKAGYRYASWGRILVHYDYVKLNGGFIHGPMNGFETTYQTITGVLEFYLADSAILIVQVDNADWQRKVTSDTGAFDYTLTTFYPAEHEEKLTFNRLTVGARATF